MQNERAVCQSWLETFMSFIENNPELSAKLDNLIELFDKVPLYTFPDNPWFISLEAGAPILHFYHNEETGVKSILHSIKKAARFLKNTAGLKQTQCLEIIALSAGFDNWYGLNKFLTSYKAHAGARSDHCFYIIRPILPLMAYTAPGIGPTELIIKKMEKLADTLASLSGVDRQLILDGVFAKLCHSCDWNLVKQNAPAERRRPKYEFFGNDPDNAYVKGNFDCQSLMVTLEGVGFWYSWAKDLVTAKNSMIELVQSYCDFAPGFLWLSETLSPLAPDASLYYANAGVRRVEYQIPRDDNFKFNWNQADNPLYLKLLLLELQSTAKLCNSGDQYKDKVNSLYEKIHSLTSCDYLMIDEILDDTINTSKSIDMILRNRV